MLRFDIVTRRHKRRLMMQVQLVEKQELVMVGEVRDKYSPEFIFHPMCDANGLF